VTVQGARRGHTHSPGCLSVTGYSADEFAADPRSGTRSIHEGDRTAVPNRCSACCRGESPPPLSTGLFSKDGQDPLDPEQPPCAAQSPGRLVTYDGLVHGRDGRPARRAVARGAIWGHGVLAEPVTLEAALNPRIAAVCLDLEWDLGAFWSAGNGAGTLRPQVTCVPAEDRARSRGPAGCPDRGCGGPDVSMWARRGDASNRSGS